MYTRSREKHLQQLHGQNYRRPDDQIKLIARVAATKTVGTVVVTVARRIVGNLSLGQYGIMIVINACSDYLKIT